MLRRFLTTLFVLILTFSLASSAAAQSYSFRLDREVVNVFWNADGTMSLDYMFTFTNEPGGHVIDFVDVGLPNNNYAYNTITADVNGSPVSISSDYQGSGSGVAVDLGARAIQPGGQGDVHIFVGRISNVIFPDDQDEAYASAVFEPTYFGSQYVNGSTDVTVTFHLPPGIKPEEPRWHSAPSGFPDQPETGLDTEGRVTYTWNNPNANGHTAYEFGASFPKSYVPAGAISTPAPAPAFNIDFGAISNVLCCGFFALMFFGIPAISAVQGQRRKLQYMPPRVAIEGHGIKRGLTAVEAAVLMEQSLDKVLTMILFGTLKKNAAQVTNRNPLTLQVTSPLPEGLREYEADFLKAFQEQDAKTRQRMLREMMIKLIRQVSEHMRGFSHKETVDYYKAIMERAWQQVEAADTPEVKSQKLDEAMEWTMLDRDYDGRMQRTFQGPIFVPTWWGRYDPTYGGGSVGGAAHTAAPTAASTSQGPRSLPGADFAASVVGGVQSFSSRVIGDLNTFTSSVTGVTNPPPKPSVGSASRGGGRSGGGCACACACAGCACACAGGGR